MSRTNSGSSCLSIFIKSWLGSALLSGLLLVAAVGLGIRYFGWDATSWTQISSWTSYPVLALVAIMVASTGFSLVASTLFGAAKMFLRGGGEKPRRSTNRSARPQSHRKTTV